MEQLNVVIEAENTKLLAAVQLSELPLFRAAGAIVAVPAPFNQVVMFLQTAIGAMLSRCTVTSS